MRKIRTEQLIDPDREIGISYSVCETHKQIEVSLWTKKTTYRLRDRKPRFSTKRYRKSQEELRQVLERLKQNQ